MKTMAKCSQMYAEKHFYARSQQKEKKLLSVAVSMPKIRRGQAFNDLLMQMEHQKLHELESLVERGAVSNFAHRRRIQVILILFILLLSLYFIQFWPFQKHIRWCSIDWSMFRQCFGLDLCNGIWQFKSSSVSWQKGLQLCIADI